MSNYINAGGTLQKSFKIGTRSIMLCAGDIIDNGDPNRLYVVRPNSSTDPADKVAYDSEIPRDYIVGLEYDEENSRLVLTCMINGSTTTTTVEISNTRGTVTTVFPEGESTVTSGNLISFADTEGTQIQDTGVTITNNVSNINSSSVVPTGAVVASYVGLLASQLKIRTDGFCYILDEDNKKYKVTLLPDGTYDYIEVTE